MEGVESETFQCQGQILSWRTHRDLEGKSEEVKWPKIVITHAFPEKFGSDGLTVVHVAFGGIFSNHSVDHDDFFPVECK